MWRFTIGVVLVLGDGAGGGKGGVVGGGGVWELQHRHGGSRNMMS